MTWKKSLWVLPLALVFSAALVWMHGQLAAGAPSTRLVGEARIGGVGDDAPDGPVSPDAAELKLALAKAKGSFGVTVYDDLDRSATVEYRPNASFKMLSVVKLLIALDTLDRGGDPHTVGEMLKYSDDGIARSLWWEGGKNNVIDRMTRAIGLSHTHPPDNPIWWGYTTSTAADLVRIYRYILHEAPDSQRRTIISALEHASRLGADGFNQYFGIPRAAGRLPWAAKQGWSCCAAGRMLHTTGTVGAHHRYIVIILAHWPKTTTWASDRKQINAVARALVSV